MTLIRILRWEVCLVRLGFGLDGRSKTPARNTLCQGSGGREATKVALTKDRCILSIKVPGISHLTRTSLIPWCKVIFPSLRMAYVSCRMTYPRFRQLPTFIAGIPSANTCLVFTVESSFVVLTAFGSSVENTICQASTLLMNSVGSSVQSHDGDYSIAIALQAFPTCT